MTAVESPPQTAQAVDPSGEQEGYQKSLKPRQIQMIAMGGAIGTGLFMGAGQRLRDAGPALFVVYAICGVFVFFVLRALGELVLHRTSSGSFVSYAREFLGEKAAFAAGWMYFLNWAFTAVAEATAVAVYFHYWTAFAAVPQWLIAFIALSVVLTMNLISVKLFGEMEFWAALVKVTALTAFLIVAIVFLAGRFHIQNHVAGTGVVSHDGGWLPAGISPLVLVISGVVFAYGGVELVGTAAGETENPAKIMPRAINSVIGRIALFYVGSVLLLALLLPHTDYRNGESPFVSFFSRVGVSGVGSIMNGVVLTAALSSLNAGLYSTGRILRSMSMNGSAPRFMSRMSRHGVPYGGILLTAGVGYLGVILNAIAPGQAFDIVLNLASLGIIAAWATIVICQLQLFRWSKKGLLERPAFRMPLAPYSGYVTLAFLFAVIVIMGFDHPIGTWTVSSLVVIIPGLVGGWYLARGRVLAMAQERLGYTGSYPVVATTPLQAEYLRDNGRDADRGPGNTGQAGHPGGAESA